MFLNCDPMWSRPWAICAIPALPYLQPLLDDKTDPWPVDNHGPMLRVCDLAKEAIEQLRQPAAAAGAPSPSPAASEGLIHLYDESGQRVSITRDQWRSRVLPANLKKEWDNPDGLFPLIVAAIDNGFRAEIIDAARRLYQIDSDPARAAGLWSAVLIEEGRLDEAESAIRGFLEQHGDNAAILTHLGRLYARRNNPAEAEKILTRALQLDPNQHAAIALYESVVGQRGAAAVEAGLERIASSSGSWLAQVELARAALESGQLERALACYRDSISHAPRPVPTDLLARMSGALGNHGHLAELLALAEPLFTIDVHGVQVGNNLIKAHLQLGQTDAACWTRCTRLAGLTGSQPSISGRPKLSTPTPPRGRLNPPRRAGGVLVPTRL